MSVCVVVVAVTVVVVVVVVVTGTSYHPNFSCPIQFFSFFLLFRSFNNSTTTPIHLHRAEVNREERETRDERAAMEPAHPYYPLDAKVVGYLANDWDVPTLVCAFLGGWGALLLLTLAVVSVARPSLKMGDKVAILWFVLSE